MSKEREKALEQNFNKLVEIWYKNKKSFREMTMDDVVLLKRALSSVNNIATLKATVLLVERLAGLFPMINKKKEEILRAINVKSANSNGFDIEWTDGINVVAEVKCNIPIGSKNAFGSQQKSGISKDLGKLRYGNKKTGKLQEGALKAYHKFLGIYVHDEQSEEAVRNFCNTISEEYGKVEILDKDVKKKTFDEHTIYVVMLGND